MNPFIKRLLLQSSQLINTSKLKYNAITTKHIPKTLQELSYKLNQLTGYQHIEHRKLQVLQKDQIVTEARSHLRSSKQIYEDTIDSRKQCQKEINALLQRKHTWTGADLDRFTDLYKDEVELEKKEMGSRTAYKEAADALEKAQLEYLK
jgi:sensitive to high expression protein 9, mitochondrial